MMRHRRRWMHACLVAAALLSGCGEENTYKPPPPPVVDVATPLRQPVTRYLEVTGYTAPVNTVDLVARVSGFLEAIHYQDGAVVKEHAPLFTIEPEPYRLQLDQAQAGILGAQARLLQADTEYKRQLELVKHQNTPQSMVDQALAKRDGSRADLDQAKINVGLARINYGYTEVQAPFDGLVTAHLVSVGELVGNGPTKLATIIQLDPIYANFNVSEQDVLRIRQLLRESGMSAADMKTVDVELGLQTETGYPHKGKFDYAAPAVDPKTGTLAVRGIFANPDRALMPGNFVRVRVPLERIAEALLVPAKAIGTDQGGRYVLVAGPGNVVEQRKVALGPTVGELQVIDTGLKAEDRVVVSGLMQAIPGQKVEPHAAAEPGASPAPAAPATK